MTRLVPARPLPPYSYVPGRWPHPVSDPAGYSHGITPAPALPLDPERWADSETYLYGFDLFNAAYYWQAHVEWESLWLAAGRRGPVADFLKGLIKLAAAGVKHLEGVPAGVRSHAQRAAELWRAQEAEKFLGLRRAALIEAAEQIARAGWPAQPVLLVPCRQSTEPEA